VSDLRLVDVLSLDADEDGWELALIFRAELMALPRGDDHRAVALIDGAPGEAIQRFAPVELDRWIHAPASVEHPNLASLGPNLVF